MRNAQEEQGQPEPEWGKWSANSWREISGCILRFRLQRFIAEQLNHSKAKMEGKQIQNVTSIPSHMPLELSHLSNDMEQHGKDIVETGYEPSEPSEASEPMNQ